MAFQSDLCDHAWAPFATSVTTAAVAAILSIITVPGNLLICWAVFRNPRGNLKSAFNYLVLNLAIADLIVGAVTEPVSIGYHVNEALKHPVRYVKWVLHISYFLTSTASVLSIIALTVNRYKVATSNRIERGKISSAVATSVALWLCSLGLSLVYMAVGFYLMAFTVANTAIVISIGVLVFVYHRIYHRLKQHQKACKNIRRSTSQAKRLKREERITISFLLMIISFIACAAPSMVMIYVINLCHTCDCVLIHWFRDLQFLFLLLNSATNQFLYAWRMRCFQAAFKTIPTVRWIAGEFARARISGQTSNLDRALRLPRLAIPLEQMNK